MNKSNTISKLAAALSEAQAEMPSVPMNAKNPFLKNSYADLGSVIETSRPILAKHSLSVSQFPVSGDKCVGVTTILMHSSGEFLEDTILVPLEIGKGLSVNQASGVSITYLRRYALSSVLGLYADEDTDGNHVEKEAKEPKFRVWGIDQMEVVISFGGIATTHEEAAELLEYSNLPDTASVKLVESWLKHFANAGKDTTQECADVANQAYLKAKGVK